MHKKRRASREFFYWGWGIDLIKRMGLGLDPITNDPYIVKKITDEASVTKDIMIPARSRQVRKVRIPSKFMTKGEDNFQILSVSVPSAKQIFPDEILIQPNCEGVAKIYLTNSSYNHQQLLRGEAVGKITSVSADDLNRFPVSSTTPFAVPEEVQKKMKIPPLDDNRRKKILSLAHLDHLDPDLKDKYTNLLN